jgi:hypothetical protein
MPQLVVETGEPWGVYADSHNVQVTSISSEPDVEIAGR